MMRHLSHAISLSTFAVILGFSGTSRADVCATMLQPYFTRAGNIPFEYYPGVRLTFTAHNSVSGSTPALQQTVRPDYVSYGDAYAYFSAPGGVPQLTALTPDLFNSGSSYFQYRSNRDWRIDVAQNGILTLGRRVNNKNIGGLPSIVLQGTCSSGFVYGFANGEMYTITLELVPYEQVPPG